MDMSLSKLQEIMKDREQSMGSQRVGHDLATEQQWHHWELLNSDWKLIH